MTEQEIIKIADAYRELAQQRRMLEKEQADAEIMAIRLTENLRQVDYVLNSLGEMIKGTAAGKVFGL